MMAVGRRLRRIATNAAEPTPRSSSGSDVHRFDVVGTLGGKALHS
jgi:hypothetical protein